MPTVTARIEPAGGRNQSGLWLFIDNHADLQFDHGIVESSRDDLLDEAGRVAMPLLPEEVEAVRDACQAWLDKQNAELDEVVDRVLEANA